MRHFFGYIGPFTWIVILCWLVYFVGRLLGSRPGRSKPKPRTSLNWPDRSLRPFGQRPVRALPAFRPLVRPASSGASSELEVEPPGAASVNSLRMLFIVTLHNRAAVERLINYERGRSPGISRNAAIVRAYERWMDDNR